MIKMFRNGYKQLEKRLEEGMPISLTELRRQLKERHYQPIYLRDGQGNIYLRAENRNMKKDAFYHVLTPIDITRLDTPQQIKLKRIKEQDVIEDIVHKTYPIFEISDFSATPTPMHHGRECVTDGFVGIFRYQ